MYNWYILFLHTSRQLVYELHKTLRSATKKSFFGV